MDVWQTQEEQKKVAAKAKLAAKESRREHEEFVLDKISQAVSDSLLDLIGRKPNE